MNAILTTGFSGMVGSRFVEMYADKYEIYNLGKKEGVDITNYEQVLSQFEQNEAPVVIHMAGKTDVDGCEDDKLLQEEGEAWQLNVIATENIVKAAQKTKKRVIYISTDFVFNGTKDSYDEDDEPDPVNFYGFTKYQGELAVSSSELSFAILRISYPYRADFPAKKDFVRRVLEVMKTQKKITAVTDHVFTPTFIDDIAQGLDAFLQKEIVGTFHLVGSSSLSVFEATQLLAKTFELKSEIIPTTREAFFKHRAYRPFKLALKNDRIVNLGVKMNSFADGLLKLKERIGFV